MYKWPQGRVIRVICLIMVAVIAADFAWNGAYKGFGTAASSADQAAHIRQLVQGGFFAACSLATLIAGLIMVGFLPRTVDFLVEVESEMTRVEWPEPGPLFRTTLVVGLVLVVVAATVLAVDYVFITLMRSGLPALKGWI